MKAICEVSIVFIVFMTVVPAVRSTGDGSTPKPLTCMIGKKESTTGERPNWVDMEKKCTSEVHEQIKKEITASMQYLAMGAHFSRDVINRPGFAKLFFEAATEEREHANKLISYLLMRGELTQNVRTILPGNDAAGMFVVRKNTWNNGVDALKDALELEANVTTSIKGVIKVCEQQDAQGFNNYHLVDYLTGEFLDEQYKGQRDLAGKLSTLNKMMDSHGALGEFLYDKKLLHVEA